ncbi:hypothetical protein CFOL_v3_33924 [Cephalotus follicularis]|uniref:GUB_WAK_bind domain-containing protein n=1 Tax=Cephalotus follicularis TaxID=3775 RepID=A0A1Q3DDK7_CEPFO|nr:hypothetical protein CFOL_v3_33924 [Cephalotus follicularis]
MKAPHQVLLYTVVLILTHTTTYTFSVTHYKAYGTYQVPYPLSTVPTYSDHDYTILCDTNTNNLLFNTLNNTYPITTITSSNQRLTIKPSPLLPNTSVTSNYIHQGIQLNSSLPFNITSSNTIMYLNCTIELLSSPMNYNASSLCHAYVNNTVVAAACVSSLRCTFRAGGTLTSPMIRVRDSRCRGNKEGRSENVFSCSIY